MKSWSSQALLAKKSTDYTKWFLILYWFLHFISSTFVCANVKSDLLNLSNVPNGHQFPQIFKVGDTFTQFAIDFVNNNYTWSISFCSMDSDSDGKTNGDELGDPCCVWGPFSSPRRTNESSLSDPSDPNHIVSFGSAMNEITLSKITVDPTAFSASIGWIEPNPLEATVCSYEIYMSTLTGLDYQNIQSVNYHSNSFTVLDLEPEMDYGFRVRGVNLRPGKTIETTTRTSKEIFATGSGDNCSRDTIQWSDYFPINTTDYSSLLIPFNKTVELDMDTVPEIGTLEIQGCLIFKDDGDKYLAASLISVTGLLQIGTEEDPFTNKATITLTGDSSNSTNMGIGNKLLIVTAGGLLSLHGRNHSISWTRLNRTAREGDSIIRVEEPVNTWSVGDEIIISSTDYDYRQAEIFTITDVSSDGRDITLNRLLNFMHYGEDQFYLKSDGKISTLSERAEVGLLSRNIVIQGDESSPDSSYGGQTMFTSTSKIIQIHGVEFRRMGQRGIIGRYPVHFHMKENATKSYVKHSSIHDSYQRGLVLQKTNRLIVSDTIVANTFGHGFMLEGGVEESNIFYRCLSLGAKEIHDDFSISYPKNVDATPASFFISNTNNNISLCAAGGSAGYGLWYYLTPYATMGTTMTAFIQPDTWFWGSLNFFIAHSNAIDGISIGPSFSPCAYPNTPGVGPCGSSGNPYIVPEFIKLQAYRNKAHGFFAVLVSTFELVDSVFADNPIGLTFERLKESAYVGNSIFVGESSNRGNPGNCSSNEQCYECEDYLSNPDSKYRRTTEQKDTPLIGVKLHKGGGTLLVDDLDFFDYQSNCVRRAMAIDLRNEADVNVNPLDFVFKDVHFHQANQLYHFANSGTEENSSFSDMYQSAVLLDQDGSLTRIERQNISALVNVSGGFMVVPNNPIMIDPERCYFSENWNMYICKRDLLYYSASIEMVNKNSISELTPVLYSVTQSNGKNLYIKFLGTMINSHTVDYRMLIPRLSNVQYHIDWSTSYNPQTISLKYSYDTAIPVYMRFHQEDGPIQTLLSSQHQQETLNPVNSTKNNFSLDCLTNEVKIFLMKQITTQISMADEMPPYKQCLPLNKTYCKDVSYCGEDRTICIGVNKCVCKWGWWGHACQHFHCAHVHHCSGQGSCIGPNICRCFPGRRGEDCSERESVTYSPVVAFGDVHLQTLDDVFYQFNSIGEFYLLKSKELSLQSQLVPCRVEDNLTSVTSCLRSLAFTNGLDRVEMYPYGVERVVLMLNGERVAIGSGPILNAPQLFNGTSFVKPSLSKPEFYSSIRDQTDPQHLAHIQEYVSAPNNLIQLQGGATIREEFLMDSNRTRLPRAIISVDIETSDGMDSKFFGRVTIRNDGVGYLSVSVAIVPQNSTFTGDEKGGLLGTPDRNPDNEFILRNGTVLIHPDTTTIHLLFGETWRVPFNESLFSNSTANTDHSVFTSLYLRYTGNINTTGEALKAKAIAVCSDTLGLRDKFLSACLYDISATRNIQYALASATAQLSIICDIDNANSAVCQKLACPNFCNLNGMCVHGVCQCDDTHSGEDCKTTVPGRLSWTPYAIAGIVIGGVVAVTATLGFIVLVVLAILRLKVAQSKIISHESSTMTRTMINNSRSSSSLDFSPPSMTPSSSRGSFANWKSQYIEPPVLPIDHSGTGRSNGTRVMPLYLTKSSSSRRVLMSSTSQLPPFDMDDEVTYN